MEAIVRIIDAINNLLSIIIMPLLALIALAYVFLGKLLPGWIRKNGIIRGLYICCITLVPIGVWVGIFGLGIVIFSANSGTSRWTTVWGAFWIGATFFLLIHLLTKEYGEKRGIYSMFFHLGVFFLGWIFKKWLGIFFISLPILVAYYGTLYYLADGIIPANDPEDKKEKWQRFKVFAWYTWGLQYPIQVANDKTAPKRDSDIRINGSPSNSFFEPGLIWIRSHQAVALTSGTNFSRIEGAKVIFTKSRERILEVIDLRTHKRTNTIDVVSRDGVRFRVTVSASFVLDQEIWSPDTYNQLYRKNPILARGRRPDGNIDQAFPFSRPRIQAALRMRGTTSVTHEDHVLIFWDDRVMNQVEVVASHVLSERRFEELWRPINDGPGISALDEIADQIKERIAPDLLAQGVRLFAARVLDFDFSEYKEVKESEPKASDGAKSEKNYNAVIKQQIKSWRVDWESQRTQIIADADAEANRLQQAARAHVQSVLLTAIAEGLEQTRTRYPDLSPHVIAMLFLGALEQLVDHEQKSEDESEEAALSLIKSRIRWSQERKDR